MKQHLILLIVIEDIIKPIINQQQMHQPMINTLETKSMQVHHLRRFLYQLFWALIGNILMLNDGADLFCSFLLFGICYTCYICYDGYVIIAMIMYNFLSLNVTKQRVRQSLNYNIKLKCECIFMINILI